MSVEGVGGGGGVGEEGEVEDLVDGEFVFVVVYVF